VTGIDSLDRGRRTCGETLALSHNTEQTINAAYTQPALSNVAFDGDVDALLFALTGEQELLAA
jgi:hypothetical protein